MVAVRVTVYKPGASYTTNGLLWLDVAGEPPGNDQLTLVVLADDWLTNCTTSGLHPMVLVAVKPAVGGNTMVTDWVAVEVPQALVEVSTTV